MLKRSLPIMFAVTQFFFSACDSSFDKASKAFLNGDPELAKSYLNEVKETNSEMLELQNKIDSSLLYLQLKTEEEELYLQLKTEEEERTKRIHRKRQDSIRSYELNLGLVNDVVKSLEDWSPPYIYDMSDIKPLFRFYSDFEKKLDNIYNHKNKEVSKRWTDLSKRYNKVRRDEGPVERRAFGSALGRLFQSQGTEVTVAGSNNSHIILEGIAFHNRLDRLDVKDALQKYIVAFKFKRETYRIYEGSAKSSSWDLSYFANDPYYSKPN